MPLIAELIPLFFMRPPYGAALGRALAYLVRK
jgi:hypothetical protein